MHSIKRIVIRSMLLLCGVAALLAVVAAFHFKGSEAIETWLVMTAALAVITSLSTAWTAQATIEIQEDQLRPDIVVYIDTSDRYQLMLLKMKNVGKGSGFKIADQWTPQPIKNHRGVAIRFSARNTISVLHPDQSLSKEIDVPHSFYEQYTGETYNGHVTFEDAQGRKFRKEFILDPSYYKETLLYDEEAVRTHYELQQIPKKLDEIRKEISRVVYIMQST